MLLPRRGVGSLGEATERLRPREQSQVKGHDVPARRAGPQRLAAPGNCLTPEAGLGAGGEKWGPTSLVPVAPLTKCVQAQTRQELRLVCGWPQPHPRTVLWAPGVPRQG